MDLSTKFFAGFLIRTLGFALLAASVEATDHWDGPQVIKNTPADITDFYAVALENKQLLLIQNVYPGADADSRFLDSLKYSIRLRSIEGFSSKPVKALVGDDELSISCRSLTRKGSSEQRVSCRLYYNQQLMEQNRVVFNSMEGGLHPRFKVFAGQRVDQAFTDLGRVRMPVWRQQGFNDRPGVNSIAGKSVLSLVFIVDMKKFQGQYWAAVAETHALHKHDGKEEAIQIDRMGRLEVTVFIIRKDDLKDLWNGEDTFDIDPEHEGLYRKELQRGLYRLDDFEKSLSRENVIDWPSPHPMIDLFLNDYLIINTQVTGKPSDGLSDGEHPVSNYLSIERSLLAGQPISTMGGRLPNEDVIQSMMTLLINGIERPEPNRGVGVHQPDKPAVDTFPFLASPEAPEQKVANETLR